jgi:hypothetical protein
MKVKKIKNAVLVATVAVLAVSSVFLTIESATTGLEVSKLEKNEADLINQKRDLEETLVKSLSIADLQQKSNELGFVKPANLVYVTDLKPVAKLP